MATLAELAILLTAKDQASGVFSTVEKNAGGMGSAIGGIAKTVAFAGAAAAAGLGALALKSISAASDMAESQNKVNVVFGEGAGAINEFAATASRTIGVSRQAALDATGTFGNLFTQLKIGEAQSADLSTEMVKLAADFGSFHNADISEVIAAQTSAFRGEYDAVQRFVPTINAAAVQQRALAMTGKTATAMLTDQDKALATHALLVEGAGKATGDFANTSTGMANSMKRIKASVADATSTLGEKLLPILQPLISGFADKLPGALDVAIGLFSGIGRVVGPLVGMLSSFAGNLISFGTSIFNVIQLLTTGDFKGGIFGLMEDSAIIDALFRLRDGFMAVWTTVQAIAAPIASFVQTAIGSIGQLGQIGSLMSGSFEGLGAGIGPVIQSIGKMLSDQVFNVWLPALVNWAAEALPPLLGHLLGLASGILAWVKEAGGALMNSLITTWLPAFLQWALDTAPILLGTLGDLAIQLLNWIAAEGPTIAATLISWAFAFTGWVLTEALPKLIPALFKFLVALTGWILTEALPAIVKAALSMGVAIVQGILDGLESLVDKLRQKLVDAFKKAFRAVLDFLGIHSPSTLFQEVGEQMSAGLAKGFGAPQFGITAPRLGVPALAGGGLGGVAGGGGNVYVTIEGSVWSEEELTEVMRRKLIGIQNQNGSAI